FELDIDIGEALGGDVSHQVVPIRHRGPSSLTRRAQRSDRPGTDGGGETPDDAGIEWVQLIESQFRQVGSARQGGPRVALRIARVARDRKSTRLNSSHVS